MRRHEDAATGNTIENYFLYVRDGFAVIAGLLLLIPVTLVTSPFFLIGRLIRKYEDYKADKAEGVETVRR